MKRENVYLFVLVLVFLASGFMILYENNVVTGFATSETTTSSVTISQYFSISLSGNLSGGISFGTQNSTTSDDVNATWNYNGVMETNYSIIVSADSNTNVNFSTWADGHLNTSAGDEILIGNETYHNSTTNSGALPALANQTAFTISEPGSNGDVTPGSAYYYRFWLDIPAAAPVGTYNNTINFKGVSA